MVVATSAASAGTGWETAWLRGAPERDFSGRWKRPAVVLVVLSVSAAARVVRVRKPLIVIRFDRRIQLDVVIHHPNRRIAAGVAFAVEPDPFQLGGFGLQLLPGQVVGLGQALGGPTDVLGVPAAASAR